MDRARWIHVSDEQDAEWDHDDKKWVIRNYTHVPVDHIQFVKSARTMFGTDGSYISILGGGLVVTESPHHVQELASWAMS